MHGLIVTTLIFIGLGLIFIEIFFVPGTTIVGLAGLSIWGIGITLTFMYFSKNIGLWVLGGSSMLCGSMIIYSFRAGFWKKFSLQEKHSAQVRRSGEAERNKLYIGMQGFAHSDLRPVGTGVFEHEYFEVTAQSKYIEAQTPIEISHIKEHIYVKPFSPKNL